MFTTLIKSIWRLLCATGTSSTLCSTYFKRKWDEDGETSIRAIFSSAIPGLFFIYFRLFKQALQFLQQINVKQCPSSIRHWDSNPQPLEIESPPITTRPGLPPVKKFVTVSDYKSVACPTLVGPLTKILHLVGRSVSQCSSSNNISFHMHWI